MTTVERTNETAQTASERDHAVVLAGPEFLMVIPFPRNAGRRVATGE
jgi:hypothetical protein